MVDTAARPTGRLRERAAQGVMVNAAFTVGLDTLGFLKGFVVAAFLSQSEYGVWGILVVGLGTLQWLRQVGVGDKYVQQTEEDQEAAFQKAFTIELVLTGIFGLLLLAAVPIIALIYGQSEVLAPGWIAALALPAVALQAPVWVFYRRMDFFRQRVLQSIDPVLGFIVTVALAIAGAGYWALVAGMVVGAWGAAIVVVRSSPYPLRLRRDTGTVREYFSFSWPLLVSNMSVIVIAQAAMLVGEAELGLAGAGAIALASTISIYTDRVDAVVTNALYPAICAVRDRSELLFESFVKSNRLTLMWGVPFGIALTLFAPDLVDFVIGDRWEPAVGLLQAFGVIAAVNHVGFNWSAYYRAIGVTRPAAVVSIASMLVFLVTAVPLTMSNGLDGFAIGMGITTAVALAIRTYYLAKLFSGFRMLPHVFRAFMPTIPAVGVILVARWAESGERTFGLALGEAVLYIVVTLLATLTFERPLLREATGYLRRATASPAT